MKVRKKVDLVFTSWFPRTVGPFQGSLLRFLLLNIFLNDLLLNESDSNFPDDNRLYICGEFTRDVKGNLELNLQAVLEWFAKNRKSNWRLN